MKIVSLDSYTLNPGDLTWDAMAQLGKLELYDRTPHEQGQIVARSEGAEVILTNKVPLSAETLACLPNLRYIGVMATGYNIVDVEAAAKRGIVVTNIPVYGTDSVAQMTFALLLELCHHVQSHSDAVRNGDWSKSPDFCFWNHPQIELANKTIGIIGFGRIGQRVAEIADAFGMKILAADSYRVEPSGLKHFAWAETLTLLAKSDVVSLHCPLTPETKDLINRESLKLMKPNAFLLNASRGPLVADEDLAEALNAGRIAGAALDVLSVEPPKADNPLLTAKNCLITPHIAWASFEARSRLMNTLVENLKAFLAGKPVNVVSG